MQFPIVIHQDEDGVFIGSVPTLKGVHSFGKTLGDLEKNITEAIELYFEVQEEEKKEELFISSNSYFFHTITLPSYAKTESSYRQKATQVVA